MGLFFRKSKKFGPFRINFSTSGVGVSTGITGARFSVGPGGMFVHLGRQGIYYRKKIGINSTKTNSNKKDNHINLEDVFSYDQNKKIFQTTNLDSITDGDSVDFINTLEKQNSKLFLHKWLGVFPMILFGLFLTIYNGKNNKAHQVMPKETKIETFFRINTAEANLRKQANTNSLVTQVARKGDSFPILENNGRWLKIKPNNDSIAFVHNSVGEKKTYTIEIQKPINNQLAVANASINEISNYLILIFIPLIIILFFYDKKRKSVEIYYSMDKEHIDLYDLKKKFFREFLSNHKIWQKTSSHSVIDSRYHAGAGDLVNRKIVRKVEADSLPTQIIKTNVEIPHISLTNIDLYFFPERLILKRKNKYAGIFYKNISMDSSSFRFIEEENVPRDATVVGKTWKYVNNDGGPDRRFRNNNQLPICAYTEYHIKSKKGLNEVIVTSRKNGMANFSNFIGKLAESQTAIKLVKKR